MVKSALPRVLLTWVMAWHVVQVMPACGRVLLQIELRIVEGSTEERDGIMTSSRTSETPSHDHRVSG